jgi:integrase
MLAARPEKLTSEFVFAGRGGKPMLVTSLDHLHAKVRKTLKMPADFVVHSLRHAMLTRLGMLGVDAFTIMKIAGHGSITISQLTCIRRRNPWRALSRSWRCPTSFLRGRGWA